MSLPGHHDSVAQDRAAARKVLAAVAARAQDAKAPLRTFGSARERKSVERYAEHIDRRCAQVVELQAAAEDAASAGLVPLGADDLDAAQCVHAQWLAAADSLSAADPLALRVRHRAARLHRQALAGSDTAGTWSLVLGVAAIDVELAQAAAQWYPIVGLEAEDRWWLDGGAKVVEQIAGRDRLVQSIDPKHASTLDLDLPTVDDVNVTITNLQYRAAGNAPL
ncbi:hypothetical protein GXP71_00485 [Cellulomonas sp. H30R-01]|uniref:hypothetical protein n=1 Tax=Cellulomonas sp. H30R-01 TaxID=2704467 RepID=UPI00138BDEF0|nr:hypothetical protein [Cellulomonas sp. H30R-01]QHT54726.1 hypothetical protein GXP71_00485 [Cellulomonas sp. H30R-01]